MDRDKMKEAIYSLYSASQFPVQEVLEALLEGGRPLAKMRAKFKKIKAKREAQFAEWELGTDEDKERIEKTLTRDESVFEVSEEETDKELA